MDNVNLQRIAANPVEIAHAKVLIQPATGRDTE